MKARVRNAADPEQVKRARDLDTYSRDDELNDLRSVLGTFSGRRFLWRLLSQTRSFETIFAADVMTLSYNSGRQDFGHFLIDEIGQADPSAWILMQQEANRIEGNRIEPAGHPPDEP